MLFQRIYKYLASLLDVQVSSPANGQTLIFNSSTQTWQNGTVPAADTTGLLPVTGGEITGNLQIDGTLNCGSFDYQSGQMSFNGPVYVDGTFTSDYGGVYTDGDGNLYVPYGTVNANYLNVSSLATFQYGATFNGYEPVYMYSGIGGCSGYAAYEGNTVIDYFGALYYGHTSNQKLTNGYGYSGALYSPNGNMLVDGNGYIYNTSGILGRSGLYNIIGVSGQLYYPNGNNLVGAHGSSGCLYAPSGGVAIDLSGNVYGTGFNGNGAGLTALNASNISGGTIANAYTTAVTAATASTIALRDANAAITANGFFEAINTTAKTAAYTVLATDATIQATNSGSAYSITLPTAVGIAGRIYRFKKTDNNTNTINIATTSSQTIDGSTTYALSSYNAKVAVQSNGSNWITI